jgi:hypothetical protein
MQKPHYSLDQFNAWLKPTGTKIKIMSAPELSSISVELTKRSFNSDSTSNRQTLERYTQDIDQIVYLFRNSDKISLMSISILSRKARSLLARWLGNTYLDKNQLKDQLA